MASIHHNEFPASWPVSMKIHAATLVVKPYGMLIGLQLRTNGWLAQTPRWLLLYDAGQQILINRDLPVRLSSGYEVLITHVSSEIRFTYFEGDWDVALAAEVLP